MSDRDLAVAAAKEFASTSDPYPKWVEKGKPPTHWAAGFALLDRIDVGPPPPPPVPAGWSLVFADDFDGSTIDGAKWNVRNNDTSSHQLAYWTNRPANIFVANGCLTLRAVKESLGGKAYTSAVVDTHAKFEQKYGRWEMRAKMPQYQGAWPGFWLRDDIAGGAEFDIVECVGGLPQLTTQTVWASTNGGANVAKHSPWPFAAPWSTADFHVYAGEWQPGEIREYVDGIMVNRVTAAAYPWLDTAFANPMHAIISHYVGGAGASDMPNWYGKPVGSIPAGTGNLVIDYVRVYKAGSA